MNTLNTETAVATVTAPKASKAPAVDFHADFYRREYLKGWSSRECGPAITQALINTVHAVALGYDGKGKRPGHEALHIAMALRPEGCTVRQFQIAGSCGPANNYRRKLVRAKLFTEQVTGKPYAYVLTLTAKGQAAYDRGMAAMAADATAPASKPAKGKGKAAKGKGNARTSKPRKGNTVPVTAPAPVVTDAPATAPVAPVSEPTPAEATPQG